jgi:HK97 family phage major capsid protein
MNGYPVVVTNQINSGCMFFGDFSQAILGEWSALDILVDPYSNSTIGNIRVVALISCDIGVRHGVAFAYSSTVA